jgi:SOS-response transcriptional repressor LexA
MRRRLGLTLDELAGRASISKPYLSLIETGRVPNPPSDEKLRRLEQVLGFTPGELVTQAHLQRTPRDVRAMLQRLITQGSGGRSQESDKGTATATLAPEPGVATIGPVNLDDAYLSGVLQDLVDRHAGNIETVRSNAVPVINRVSAGYPKDFTDLSYPPRVADEYVGCPDVRDNDAFAARVHGDSMTPKYGEGDIVIFSPAAAPKDGDDCFVRFEDGHTTFKRVFFESGESGKGVIRLQPRNEKYRPQTVPAEQITGLYKAVYRYQRVDEE